MDTSTRTTGMKRYPVETRDGASTAKSMKALTDLEEKIRANPYDADSRADFCDAFHKFENHPGEMETEAGLRLRTEYWILKFLNIPGDWLSLNRLGRRFAHQKKHYLARMCFLESLRLKPVQEEIFEELQTSCDSSPLEYLPTCGTDENLISVIMGTCNRTDEIRESIQSVLDQTYPGYELLIINDGGPEKAEEIVRSFHSQKIRYFRMRDNRGHASVLNEGVKRSAGRYIAYLDDDDVYYPNHLESMHKAIASSGKKFVYSNTKFVRGDLREGKFIERKLMYRWNEEYDRDKLILNNYIANLGVVHEKSIFSRVGLFSEDLNMVMDWDFWLRASLVYPFHHLDQDTSEYRFTGKNVTSRNRLWIDFYTNLVKNFHMYYKGLLSLAMFHWNKGEKERASVLYQEIKNQYGEYFKAGDSYASLADLALIMKDYIFIDRIIVDYFRIDPRGCLKYVKGKKSARMVRGIMPLMPGKIFKVVQNRVRSGGDQ
ncbi:MAG: glycosyltransferase [Deltaproteobacteria bacterium]|nr:MAG: glycosyltransferase [Deltaproteobacteria bacterium]